MRKGIRVLLLSVSMCIVIAGTAAAMGGKAIAGKVKTLAFMTMDNYYAPKSYAQDLPVWKIVEEQLGIDIEWVVAPSAQYQEMVNIKMATGEDLPDVIWGRIGAQKWGELGLLVDIKPLIDKYKPQNIMQLLEESPYAKLVSYTPEGKMYGIWNAGYQKYVWSLGVLVRGDWLKKLNLKTPTTSEEFVNVLRRFRDEDVNGSGIPDEYLCMGGWSGAWQVLGQIFGLHLVYSGGFYPDGNEKIQCDWTSNKAKGFAEWMKMLYEEQILNPEFLTENSDRFIAMGNKNKVGAISNWLQNYIYFTDLIKEGVPEVEFIGCTALKGPFGDQMTEVEMPTDNPTSISKDADMELAIKFIDYCWSRETNIMRSFGIEGETYVIENGKYKFTDKVLNNPDGLNSGDVLRSIGAAWNGPRWATEEAYLAAWESPIAKYSLLNRPYYHVQSPHGRMTLSEEESEIVKTYKTDIDTYINENFVKFILGEKDIEEFDEYVKKLNSMGLDKLIQVYQQQHNRYLKIMKE